MLHTRFRSLWCIKPQLCEKLAAQMSTTQSCGMSQSGAAATALVSESREGCALFPPGGETPGAQNGWWWAPKRVCMRWAPRCERNHLTQRRCFRTRQGEQPGRRDPEANTEPRLLPPGGLSQASRDVPSCSGPAGRGERPWGCLPSGSRDGRLLGSPALRTVDERPWGQPALRVVDGRLRAADTAVLLQVVTELLWSLQTDG